jgi:hypothetical protein
MFLKEINLLKTVIKKRKIIFRDIKVITEFLQLCLPFHKYQHFDFKISSKLFFTKTLTEFPPAWGTPLGAR